MTTIAQQALPRPEIPYRGIEPFRFIDQRVFSVREDETWDLLTNVLIYRGVLLYGDSGSGKSSLINAGLIPAALRENLLAHRIRIQPRRGREIKIERIPIESADSPPYLPSLFVDPSSPDSATSFEISLADFCAQLNLVKERAAERLGQRETGQFIKPEEGEPRPLLIVDQFEEFITLFEEALHGGETPEFKQVKMVAREIQNDILNAFTSVLQDQMLPVKILFVFREEYLAKLDVLFKVSPELLDQYVRLLPPRVEDAEQIILAPFIDEELKNKFEVKTSTEHVRSFEGPLTKMVAAQIAQRSESGFINLSELQIVCRKLWESSNPVKYFQTQDSNIQKVLEDYWADVLKKLGDLHEPAIALLGHMVTSTNTRNIVSEPDLKSRERDNFTPRQIDDALNALVDSKLVRREPRHKIYFYEIASEFLVSWIQQKKAARLAQIEAERIAFETNQKLEQVERSRRNLTIGSIVLGFLLILCGILAFWALNLYRSEKQALDQLANAQKQRDEAQKLITILGELTSVDPPVRLAAIKELIVLDQKGQVPQTVVPFIVAVIANDQSKEIAYAGKYFFDLLKEVNSVQSSTSDESQVSNLIIEAAKQNTVLADSRSSISLPPRAYFQLASDSQRGRADQIATALRGIGFRVPAYRVIGSGTRSTNQLRYYKPVSDVESSAIANNLQKALLKIRETDGPNWSSVELPSSSAVRPGHFELWFASERPETLTPTQTPTPAKYVVLRLTFVNEQGTELPIRNPTVTLERNPFTGRQLIERSSSVSAPPGNYILFVQAPGHQLYRAEITLEGAEIKHSVTLRTRSQQ